MDLYKHVNILVDAETYKILKEFCHNNNKTISDVMRKGLTHVLKIPRMYKEAKDE